MFANVDENLIKDSAEQTTRLNVFRFYRVSTGLENHGESMIVWEK